MMSAQLKVTRKEGSTFGIIEATDRLNATIAPEIKEQLNQNLTKSDTQFILDLGNIKFIDSTGIAILISALKTARQNNGEFRLRNVNKEVMGLLSLMKLDKVFDFEN